MLREAKFETLKMSWALKLRTNQSKLKQLQRSLGIIPKTKIHRKRIHAVVPVRDRVGSLPRASPLQPPMAQRPADVIEIDDDE